MVNHSGTQVNHGNKMELDALVIASHSDDAELGMGGAILKMLLVAKKNSACSF